MASDLAGDLAGDLAIAGEAMAEQLGHQLIVIGQRHQAIADVARRQHVELSAQPPGTLAIVRDGDNAFAWRVHAGKLQKVKLTVGDRDARSGEFVIKDGLAAGDVLLRYPGSGLHDGQAAQLGN